MRVLMVCLGNICRSPMAEGILQSLVKANDLDWEVDSAGTSTWHIGERPDRRAIATCDKNGLDIRHQHARQFHPADFDDFDLILVMDRSNYQDVIRMAGTQDHKKKVQLMTAYGNSGYVDVPDPYFDGSFDSVFILLQDLCNALISPYLDDQEDQ